MNKVLRNSLVTAWMVWIGLGMVANAKATGPKPRFSVCLRNYAGVAPSKLRKAEKIAQEIFERAGVETTWADWTKPSKVNALPGADDAFCVNEMLKIYVNLLDHAAFGLPADVLGVTLISSGQTDVDTVFVFDQVANELVEQQRIADKAEILGHAVAHEIGHILNRTEKHSPTGLMRANWQREDFRAMVTRRLNFNSQQAARIREEVTRRTTLQNSLELASSSR